MKSYGATEAGARATQDGAASSRSGYRDEQAHGVPEENEHQGSQTLQALKQFYERNFGLFLVFLAQTCGSIMSTAAKLLTTNYEQNFHALQIIFVRMLCTTILSCIYIWYNKIPRSQGVTGLLILRGTAGFVGLFGLYYGLTWLEFTDATVITFVIPTMTAIVCFVWLREPFTVKEALAGLIAFTGVLFIARPPWLFPGTPLDPISGEPHEGPASISSTPLAFDTLTIKSPNHPEVSTQQRTIAILIAILGTFGASTAYATIRVIGTRAHSLISVTYFAFIATLGSAFFIIILPDLHFVVPKTLGQWGLIAIIGITGFALQFLLTEGLQREKGGRATNLTYLQLVFAIIVERIIWGTTPPIESLFGAVLIIGAALWVSLQKNADKGIRATDEESSLLGADQEHDALRSGSVTSFGGPDNNRMA